MRKHWTLFAFGVLIFFLPFLGFPSAWKTAFLFIAGIVIFGIAASFILKERTARRSHDMQPENTSFHAHKQ